MQTHQPHAQPQTPRAYLQSDPHYVLAPVRFQTPRQPDDYSPARVLRIRANADNTISLPDTNGCPRYEFQKRGEYQSQLWHCPNPGCRIHHGPKAVWSGTIQVNGRDIARLFRKRAGPVLWD